MLVKIQPVGNHEGDVVLVAKVQPRFQRHDAQGGGVFIIRPVQSVEKLQRLLRFIEKQVKDRILELPHRPRTDIIRLFLT